MCWTFWSFVCIWGFVELVFTLVIPFSFLPPYLAALLAPEVPVLDEDEDILEAMVSLGDEIGLNVEWPPRPVVGEGVDTVEVAGLPYLEEIGLRLG